MFNKYQNTIRIMFICNNFNYSDCYYIFIRIKNNFIITYNQLTVCAFKFIKNKYFTSKMYFFNFFLLFHAFMSGFNKRKSKTKRKFTIALRYFPRYELNSIIFVGFSYFYYYHYY